MLTRSRHVATLVVLLFLAGCAKMPPNLTPAAQTAWNQYEVQKDLDLVRDVAQDGNALTPPLISTATTRIITDWHTAAIKTVHDAAVGWRTALLTGLDELKNTVPAAEYAKIAHYVELAKVVVREAT